MREGDKHREVREEQERDEADKPGDQDDAAVVLGELPSHRAPGERLHVFEEHLHVPGVLQLGGPVEPGGQPAVHHGVGGDNLPFADREGLHRAVPEQHRA